MFKDSVVSWKCIAHCCVWIHHFLNGLCWVKCVKVQYMFDWSLCISLGFIYRNHFVILLLYAPWSAGCGMPTDPFFFHKAPVSIVIFFFSFREVWPPLPLGGQLCRKKKLSVLLHIHHFTRFPVCLRIFLCHHAHCLWWVMALPLHFVALFLVIRMLRCGYLMLFICVPETEV